MTALDFYKNRLKGRGFSEKQIKDLTDHKDLPWLQFAEDYHTKQLILSGVSSSAFKDELIRKTESMIWFARENYNKEYYEGVLNAMRNVQVHIKKIYKKHYC